MRNLNLSARALCASLFALSALVTATATHAAQAAPADSALVARGGAISRKPATASRATPRRAARRSRAA